MNDAMPIYLAAAIGFAWLAWVVLREPEPASGGGAITTDDPTEGGWDDWASIASQVEGTFSFTPAGNPALLSEAGLQALMRREGFSATPYPDHKGYSIGYGHLIKAGESFDRIDEGQGAQLLAADVAWAESAVRAAVTAPLTQSQFDALTSFCFNVGAQAFKTSTLVRRLNAGDPGAADEFGRWIYASGAPHPVLIGRRADERAQFLA